METWQITLKEAGDRPDCKCQAHPWENEAKERHRKYALADAANSGDKAAAQELQALQEALDKTTGKRPEPLIEQSLRQAATRPRPRTKTTSSPDKPNLPATTDWHQSVFQSIN